MAPEIELPLKNYPLTQNKKLGKVGETKIVENKHEIENGSMKL